MFNRDIFFDVVRGSLFGGSLTQDQVDGMNVTLGVWERRVLSADLRWLSYMLATAYHETAQTMQPIAEYGKGEGMAYGEPAANGQTYYGRGFVQLTWQSNYHRADVELGLHGPLSCEADPDLQLKAIYAAPTMFIGMLQGWFRTSDGAPETLGRYFNENVDDPYEAREIINGDKTYKPAWGGGSSIGQLIADYHAAFLEALQLSAEAAEKTITVLAPPGVNVIIRREEQP